MYLERIKELVEQNKFPGGFRALAEKAGTTPQNLHRCVRENKIQGEILEKIARLLGVPVGYFFDEEAGGIRTAGRDYVERGTIEHHASATPAPDTPGREELLLQIIAEKDERIADLRRHIATLENQLNK